MVGNKAITATIPAFTVDTLAPGVALVTITTPSNIRTPTLIIKSSDALSSFDITDMLRVYDSEKVDITNTFTAPTWSNGEFALSYKNELDGGQYSIYAIVSDLIGNFSTEPTTYTSFDIVIDTIAPQIVQIELWEQKTAADNTTNYEWIVWDSAKIPIFRNGDKPKVKVTFSEKILNSSLINLYEIFNFTNTDGAVDYLNPMGAGSILFEQESNNLDRDNTVFSLIIPKDSINIQGKPIKMTEVSGKYTDLVNNPSTGSKTVSFKIDTTQSDIKAVTATFKTIPYYDSNEGIADINTYNKIYNASGAERGVDMMGRSLYFERNTIEIEFDTYLIDSMEFKIEFTRLCEEFLQSEMSNGVPHGAGMTIDSDGLSKDVVFEASGEAGKITFNYIHQYNNSTSVNWEEINMRNSIQQFVNTISPLDSDWVKKSTEWNDESIVLHGVVGNTSSGVIISGEVSVDLYPKSYVFSSDNENGYVVESPNTLVENGVFTFRGSTMPSDEHYYIKVYKYTLGVDAKIGFKTTINGLESVMPLTTSSYPLIRYNLNNVDDFAICNNITPATTLEGKIFEELYLNKAILNNELNYEAGVRDFTIIGNKAKLFLDKSSAIVYKFTGLPACSSESVLNITDAQAKQFGKITTIIDLFASLFVLEDQDPVFKSLASSLPDKILDSIAYVLSKKELADISESATFYTEVACDIVLTVLKGDRTVQLSTLENINCSRMGDIVMSATNAVENSTDVNITVLVNQIMEASNEINNLDEADTLVSSAVTAASNFNVTSSGSVNEIFVNEALNSICNNAVSKSTDLVWKDTTNHIDFYIESIGMLSNNLENTIKKLKSASRKTTVADKKYDVYYGNYLKQLKDDTWVDFQNNRKKTKTLKNTNLGDKDYTSSYNATNNAGHNIDNIIPK